ncbi:uncharacterized protein [Parasteatoda tepidariorum]|uniref:uncharacterized protein isoform X1 n=1 Tax=Parasteatoda tepidariorum TaxID=114398 RepID=UPI0039BD800B
MSEDYPSNSSKKQDKKSRNNIDFVMAMGELEAYVGIFKDHYGKFPYQEKNTPFDFKREENILKELLKNHSREAIVSDDTFPSSSDNESGSSLAVVDLTDDLSEDDGDQITENVATSMQKSHTTTTLFEQDVSLDSYMVPNGFLENGNRSANETNNSNNSQEIIDTINNDSMIKTGFQHSMDVLQGNPKELQDLQEVITGSLLPSETTDDVQNWLTHRMPSPAGISISNVISGTDVSSGTDLAEVAHCDAEPVMQSTNFSMSTPSTEPEPFQSTSVFSTSSNSMHLCLRNYDRVSEAGDFCDYPPSTQFHDDEEPDIEIISELSPSGAKTKRNDTDCILQAILRCDPKSLTMLKQANRMVQQFFIQFWGATAKVPNPEKIIKHQENEIHNLKIQLEEKRREISLLKNVTYEEKMQNADNIVQCLKLRISKQDKENEKLKEELEKLNEEKKKLKEKEEKLKEESEIQKREIQNLKKELDKLEARFNERLKEAKTMKYCSLIDCSQAAKILCCYSGLRSFAYCSEKCKAKDDVHKRFECKAGKRTGPLQVAEEKEATPEQVVARGVVQQSTTTTIYLHKEITSSSATPQTANIHKMNKVVAAKKTYEMSRNINRNTNSPDIY